MTDEIRIYVEGGGDTHYGRASLRQGFNTFLGRLRDAAREKRIRWYLVPGGPRNSCFYDFCNALECHPSAFNVLLVDAEADVSTEPWEHLRTRDGWLTPASADNYHLMVQTMEAWFLADRGVLARYYGDGFLDSALPKNADVEQVDKALLESSLDNATRGTQKGKYRKIRHGAALLALINPDIVRHKAKHCDRLFCQLESLISGLKPKLG